MEKLVLISGSSRGLGASIAKSFAKNNFKVAVNYYKSKDKAQNLVKKVSELKLMNFFKGLGTYFDKVQRMRRLGGN